MCPYWLIESRLLQYSQGKIYLQSIIYIITKIYTCTYIYLHERFGRDSTTAIAIVANHCAPINILHKLTRSTIGLHILFSLIFR
jgi:hypothetical protein